ncbi:hypothetical protein AcetOrient_orf03071 [Acetobacter orientalis]|uniref:Uncharacterized protein n=1 Tax=Acetobacter orientalis TaxID=146474 RepID=A0A2Z5ZIL8_9PROT|nr:hypothetical protein AcetOrient_orf03071 [Acetobacter orientalis]
MEALFVISVLVLPVKQSRNKNCHPFYAPCVKLSSHTLFKYFFE